MAFPNDEIQLPRRLGLLPFKNKVLLPGAVIRLRCTSPASVQLIESELWQKQDRGLIGVVPVLETDPSTIPEHALMLIASTLGPDQGPPPGSEGYDGREDQKNGGGAARPKPPSLRWHPRGVAARALHLSRGMEKPGGKVTYTLVLEGLCRFSINQMPSDAPYHVAKVTQLDRNKAEADHVAHDEKAAESAQLFKVAAGELITQLEQKQGAGRSKLLLETAPAHRLADIFVASFESSLVECLAMLDAIPVRDRLVKATELVTRHLQTLRVTDQLAQKVEGQLSKGQRDLLLRRRLKAIKDELGDGDAGSDEDDDVAILEKRLEAANLPPHAQKHVKRELKRLKNMQPQMPGFGSARAHLELIAELPWASTTKEKAADLDAAKRTLDSEHYGLEKVKRRIIEYLAVRKLKNDARGPVLCFVGPPGVGKTSLASSIATALDRKFIRVSLGGVRDEADIRGHRRTYIGSMPGRIIEGIKRAGVNNPVILLDEIDKTGHDVRGDPGAALLEVLDPEQNTSFVDHYLTIPFDLSNVVWVATANRVAPIQPPLLDRMELIEIPGYTPEEKQHIATRHLIPRQLAEHGMNSHQLRIPDDMVAFVIQKYTREAGVRNLSKQLAALCRSAAVEVAKHQSEVAVQSGALDSPMGAIASMGDQLEVEMELEADVSGATRARARRWETIQVDEELVERVLGPPRFDGKEASERVATPGVVMGLVWTAVGGEVQFVEATATAGKGELHLTGQLGDVIKESAQIALTWVRARARELNLHGKRADGSLVEGLDVHIHFPAGAVPKDGPSAGVTMATALVSLLSGRCLRADTAMTGEVTLRGLVLPVGGVKDKVLAAHRMGVKRVILPERNVKDLKEVPENVLKELEICSALRMEDVLNHAFDGGYSLSPASRL